MTDEELWTKHIEEYPQIKSWSSEKREGARKGFKSGLAEGRKECARDIDALTEENEKLEKKNKIREEIIIGDQQ